MRGRLSTRLARVAAAVADPGEDRRERERRAWWERTWAARRDVLGRIDADLRPAVLDALAAMDRTGVERPAVANWVSHAASALPARSLPDHVPRAFIEFLLTDPDVAFVHDCGRCGLSVPIWLVRDTRRTADVIRERGGRLAIYPACPACGGATGYNAFHHGGSGTMPLKTRLAKVVRAAEEAAGLLTPRVVVVTSATSCGRSPGVYGSTLVTVDGMVPDPLPSPFDRTAVKVVVLDGHDPWGI